MRYLFQDLTAMTITLWLGKELSLVLMVLAGNFARYMEGR